MYDTNVVNRIILRAPFATKSTISYGLMVFCIDKKKWLLIQRKHSVEFLLFIKGIYRKTNLPILLCNITEDESNIIKGLSTYDKFKKYYIEELKLDSGILDYSWDRFCKFHERTTYYLSKINFVENALEWTWPKGRLSFCQKETPLRCAIREFEEETEIILPPPIHKSKFYITDTLHTYTGKNIESRIYSYVISEEMILSPPNNHPEVSNRRWVSTSEALDMLERPNVYKKYMYAIEKIFTSD